MPVTGNNIPSGIIAGSILSIRLTTDGLCFSVYDPQGERRFSETRAWDVSVPVHDNVHAALHACRVPVGDAGSEGVAVPELGFGRVVVEYMTGEAVFVPAVDEPIDPAGILRGCGIAGLEGMDAVRSVVSGDVAAVMAVPTALVYAIQTSLHREVEWAHPLQATFTGLSGKTTISIIHGDVYIAASVYGGGLLFCEILPAPTDADVLFYVAKLNEEYARGKGVVRVAGRDAAGLCRKLKRYNKHVVKTDFDAYH